MIERDLLELRDVERRQHVAQVASLGADRAVRAGVEGVAGVENHRSAALHIAVELADGGFARDRPIGGDGPVEQRIERQFVPRRIDGDRLARLQGGALAERPGSGRSSPALLVSSTCASPVTT